MKKLLKKISLMTVALMMLVTIGLRAEGEDYEGIDEAHAGIIDIDETPTPQDVATVSVYDVEKGLTVKAYKIVKATYDDTNMNFRGYQAIEGLQIEKDVNGDGIKDNENDGNDIVDLQDPKSEEITKIASKINKGEITAESFNLAWDPSTKAYKADLTPGYYIIKVSGLTKDNEKVYNPMLAGVYYGGDDNGAIVSVDTMVEYETEDDASTPEREYKLYDEADIAEDEIGNTVGKYVRVDSDPEGKYRKIVALNNDEIDAGYLVPVNQNDPQYWNLSGQDLYAKSSPVEVEKTVFDNIDGDVATNQDANPDAETDSKHGDDHDIGDKVTFHAKADIPDYSDEYEDLVYKVTDTLEEGTLAFRNVAGDVAEGTTWVRVHFGPKEDADEEYGAGISYELNLTKENAGTWIDASGNVVADEDLKTTEAYKITFTGENVFVLELSEKAIRTYGGQKIFLEYYAEILNGAGTNFEENTNELEVEFTNEIGPEDGGTPKTTKKKDITFHYTFELDGTLDGEEHEDGGEQIGKQSGHELAKVDENFDEAADRTITYTRQDGTEGTATLDSTTGKYMDDETGEVAIDWDDPTFEETSWTKEVVKNGLEGAEFQLMPWKEDANGTVSQPDEEKFDKDQEENKNLTTTTNAGGRLNFRGLDAGYYVLEETKAPKGYSKNTNKVVVFIETEYYEENTYYDYELTADDITEEMYPGIDYDVEYDVNGNRIYKPIQFHKGELKNYTIWRKQMTEQEFNNAKADLSQIDFTSGEKSVYEETRVKETHNGTVDYGVTTEVTGAASTFIQNTKLPVLPSTGGMGTYLFTAVGVAILAIASFLLLKRKQA
ncbi:MAG: LPXTG cell wall anchor domain-containing protein [Solobacterium sp.]|nr:LPXTG cell wall anchor domain-containing protein [Solobacterium sp.]